MNFATSLKRGLAAGTVSVALSLFSAGGAAVELVPVSCNAGGDTCGATLTPGIPSAAGGAGWDLEFENMQYLVPNGNFSLFVDFTSPGGFAPLLNDIFLTTVVGGVSVEIPNSGKSAPDAASGDAFNNTAEIQFDGLAGAEIYDFHLRCDPSLPGSFNCIDNPDWTLVSYRFDATGEANGRFDLQSAAVSSPETLALVSLALMGVAVPAARRRRNAGATAAA